MSLIAQKTWCEQDKMLVTRIFSFTNHIFKRLPGHQLLSHVIIMKTKDSSEKGMNPVVMTIINPKKEYWQRQRFEPATSCSQVFYATD